MKRYFAVLRNEVTAKSGVDTQVNVLWTLRPASVLGLHQPHLPGHPRGVQVSVFVIEFLIRFFTPEHPDSSRGDRIQDAAAQIQTCH